MQQLNKLSAAVTNLKQLLLFPNEFRLPTSDYTMVSFLSLKPFNNGLDSVESKIEISDEQVFDMIKDIGTLTWRAQKRLSEMSLEGKEYAKLSRDLEYSITSLKQAGFDIKDFTGQDYIAGMAVSVIASQTDETLIRARIIETLKPTIYYKGKIIQIGDVVIGTPKN